MNRTMSISKVAILIFVGYILSLERNGVQGYCHRVSGSVLNVFRGIDITDFDPQPIDGFNQNLKSTILNVTCFRGQVDIFSRNFTLPDQATQTSNPITIHKVDVRSMTSSSHIKNWMSSSSQLKVGFGPFSYTKSKSYRKLEETMSKRSKYFQMASIYQNKYEITIRNNPAQMHPMAVIYLHRYLDGTTFNENSQKYLGFIKLFGTHFFTKASFGGKLTMVSEVDKTFYGSKTQKEISDYAKAEANVKFIGLRARSGRESGEEIGISNSNYRAKAITTVNYYGGRADTIFNDFSNWHNSVGDIPWLLRGKMKPIYEIIPNDYKDVKKHLKAAIENYLLTTHYDEVLLNNPGSSIEERNKEFRRRFNDYIKNDNVENTFEEQREVFVRFQKNIVIPDWFKNTYLCFQSYGGANNKYGCQSSDNKNMHCIRPDDEKQHWGETHFDRPSVKDPNQCHLKWGLFGGHGQRLLFLASWLTRVELCYKYKGTDETTCKGSGQECAPFNSFTAPYVDSLEKRKGDCFIAWGIKAPIAETPIWFQRTKLCVSYGVANSKQWSRENHKCNMAIDPTRMYKRCAYTNEWTEYVRTQPDAQVKCALRWYLKTGHSEDDYTDSDVY